jgi:hypothetical protein
MPYGINVYDDLTMRGAKMRVGLMIVRNTKALQIRRDDRAFAAQWIHKYRAVAAEVERTGDDRPMRTSSAATSGPSASDGR